ncbi:MAG TPA: hypothetical protein VN853_04695 [Polyangia bacterium]|nr:hypothetical protein [Polyangia bacterium]
MGGRLEVTSTLGAGATFTVSLPRAARRSAPAEPCTRRGLTIGLRWRNVRP